MKNASKLAIYAAASVLTLGVAAAKADITVVSWGGSYRESQQRAFSARWIKVDPHVAQNPRSA
jgi:spermidine/putrescine-binding protein